MEKPFDRPIDGCAEYDGDRIRLAGLVGIEPAEHRIFSPMAGAPFMNNGCSPSRNGSTPSCGYVNVVAQPYQQQ